MFDDLDPRSPTPLYAQLAGRIRVAVATGEVQPGEPLPSVRQMAATLRVNPATVVQAYRELEADGFVTMRHGAGTFVNEIPASERRDERITQARELVRGLVEDAARLGIGAEELTEALRHELGASLEGPGEATPAGAPESEGSGGGIGVAPRRRAAAGGA